MAAVQEAPSAPPETPAVESRQVTGGRGRLVDAVFAAALFVVAAVVLLRAAETVPFHGDESEWIHNGRYFGYVFLDRDVTSNVWRPSWVNRDQPPVGRYVIGAIVWASGTAPDRVNRTFAWERDYEANLREGRVPGPGILMPVRRTMAILGAFSIALLFVAGRLVGGTITGAVAALAVTLSPLLQSYFVQARTEALLALFSMIGLIALLAFARRFQRTGRLPALAWMVGPILGLAVATKLTAVLGIAAVCAFGGAAGLFRLRTRRSEGIRMLGWTAATGVLAIAVWVAANPFLWPDPVGRTWSMLELQRSIMVEQGIQFGNPVDLALPERLVLVVRRTFVENSTPAYDAGLPPGSESLIRRTFTELPTLFGVSVELALATAGLAMLLRRVWVVWRAGARQGIETAFLWWLAAYMLGIGANLSLDWPRYYVPTAFFGSLLIGLGAQAIVGAVAGWRLSGASAPVRPPSPRPETTG